MRGVWSSKTLKIVCGKLQKFDVYSLIFGIVELSNLGKYLLGPCLNQSVSRKQILIIFKEWIFSFFFIVVSIGRRQISGFIKWLSPQIASRHMFHKLLHDIKMLNTPDTRRIVFPGHISWPRRHDGFWKRLHRSKTFRLLSVISADDDYQCWNDDN